MIPWHESEDELKEECGVVGLYTPGEDAARSAFFALFALQHRGQESAGLAASDGSVVRMYREMGLVANVFKEEILESLPGEMAIGHTRYSTTGRSTIRNAQPIFCQTNIGQVAVAHNGNLINATEIRTELEELGIEFLSTSDSEVLARYLVHHLDKGPEEAVRAVQQRARGAYSCTVLLPNTVVGFRDPHGIRPLGVASLEGGGYLVASETCAYGPLGATQIHELEPGEIVILDKDGMRLIQGVPPEAKAMCLFEFIYFARPDSEMYGTLLYTARERMGMELAKEHPVEADYVMPVPDSGVPAALGYAQQSGIPYREGMTKSRYIHRTFIEPDERMRRRGVRMKLTPLVPHLKGKRIILVDDSIVRGTTTGELVKLMFESGATEVHVRITAPPIVNPCFYGIDMASRDKLIAAVKSLEQVREHIGATTLGYLSLPGAMRAVGKGDDHFCTACFSGHYPIPVPENQTKEAFEPKDVGEMGNYETQQPRLIKA